MPTTTITPPLPDLELCLVEGGEFMMGDDNIPEASPAHRVRVSGFWMGKYPVTQRLWQAVMGNNPSKFKGERRPVEQVSWYDAQKFLQKLNSLSEVQTFVRQLEPSGNEFRLPSEAEWEYAAKGGRYTQNYKYPGSDKIIEVAWFGKWWSWATKEVAMLMPNELDLYDMGGNVWEWCQDQYGRFASTTQPLRGGSWCVGQSRCYASSRCRYNYWKSYGTVGFRIVLPFKGYPYIKNVSIDTPALTSAAKNDLYYKNDIVYQIESIANIKLYHAPNFPEYETGLMVFKENYPKYLLNSNGELIGLNISSIKLEDKIWEKIVELLQERHVKLQFLNISDNDLKNFIPPPSIATLNSLNLTYNSITNIPPDVVEAGNTAILKWLKDTGKRPILEAKVMFIGDSNYGKTSLISMLKDGHLAPGITTTHGIKRCRLPYDAASPAGNIRLNVWDLGGQQFMRSTHQLFFTERTLYVLVTEARRERSELNHWLNLVHELAADAPVLVVINKIDLDDHDIDQGPLRREYPNIKGFVRTACFDSKLGGPVQGVVALDTIKELEQAIHRIVSDRKLMPSVFAEQRQEWFTVKDELEQMEEDYISYEAYQQRPHIKDLPTEEQKLNLKQLAWLGTVVSFIDDHRLNDTHVINPQWLLDGIYRFINDYEIKEQRHGVFSFADFTRLLDTSRYPEQKYNFLVELMKKFKLCYPLRCRENTLWLLPGLLPDIEPGNVWPETDVMRFRLSYKNFPPDIFITQFIVECYQDIVDEKRWRGGVVIQDKISGCQAIIRRSFRYDYIEVEVAGPKTMRRSYLHHLLNIFVNLHIPYVEPHGKLKVVREIPYKDVWLNYDHLLKHEKNDKPYFHPELEEDISVSELLDGYGRPSREDDQLARIESKIDAHIIETRTDHNRFENKQNKLRHELERFQIELKRTNAIDERKLQAHFAELQPLLGQLAQQPEIQQIPDLADQLAALNKEPSAINIKLVASLLPTFMQKMLPLLPNIQIECDLGKIAENLLAFFKKITTS